MEAEDTVMSDRQIQEAENGASCPGAEGYEVAKTQAEISFRAGETVGYNSGFIAGREHGKQVGTKEVVEWVREQNKTSDFKVYFPQAKLKEWRIE